MVKVVLLLIFSSLIWQVTAQQPIPKVVSGRIERMENFKSQYVTPRNIDVWLPAGYSSAEKYAVLYMHDGQMLFDADNSWNKQAWNVDDVAAELLRANVLEKVIVIGIWNDPQTRHSDYFPQKPFEWLTPQECDTVSKQLKQVGRVKDKFKADSDNYLKFIVTELKPYIDQRYSVYTNKENTFIAGSSMGGLISIYAICEFPEVFFGAACLSTHWPGTFTLTNNPVPASFLNYLQKKIPDPLTHKIYFDCGDQTLDALYPEIQTQVDSIMRKKGYTSINWLTKYFPGENHSEEAWSKRLNYPLEFLLHRH